MVVAMVVAALKRGRECGTMVLRLHCNRMGLRLVVEMSSRGWAHRGSLADHKDLDGGCCCCTALVGYMMLAGCTMPAGCRKFAIGCMVRAGHCIGSAGRGNCMLAMDPVSVDRMAAVVVAAGHSLHPRRKLEIGSVQGSPGGTRPAERMVDHIALGCYTTWNR
jgi:hypothetical protein